MFRATNLPIIRSTFVYTTFGTMHRHCCRPVPPWHGSAAVSVHCTKGYAYCAGRFRYRLRFRELAPVGTKKVLCLSVQVRTVVSGSGGPMQTVGVRSFIRMISSFLFRIQSDIGAQSDHIGFYVLAF